MEPADEVGDTVEVAGDDVEATVVTGPAVVSGAVDPGATVLVGPGPAVVAGTVVRGAAVVVTGAVVTGAAVVVVGAATVVPGAPVTGHVVGRGIPPLFAKLQNKEFKQKKTLSLKVKPV